MKSVRLASIQEAAEDAVASLQKAKQMEELKILRECGPSGINDDLSLLSAYHKELGWIKVCSDCWSELYTINDMIACSTESSTNLALSMQMPKPLLLKIPKSLLPVLDFLI